MSELSAKLERVLQFLKEKNTHNGQNNRMRLTHDEKKRITDIKVEYFASINRSPLSLATVESFEQHLMKTKKEISKVCMRDEEMKPTHEGEGRYFELHEEDIVKYLETYSKDGTISPDVLQCVLAIARAKEEYWRKYCEGGELYEKATQQQLDADDAWLARRLKLKKKTDARKAMQNVVKAQTPAPSVPATTNPGLIDDKEAAALHLSKIFTNNQPSKSLFDTEKDLWSQTNHASLSSWGGPSLKNL